MSTRWDLVIFDCDGVLVDSEPIAGRVFAGMLGDIGLPMTHEEEAAHFRGRSLKDCLEIAGALRGRPVPEGFAQAYQARLLDAFRRELRATAGVMEALDRISVPVCVASSSSPARMRTALEVTGLLARFEGRLFSATEVARGKPFPDLFLYAADRMGAPPPRCAVVEDTVLGVQAGVAAGMSVFGYAAAESPGALTACGALVFTEMRELPGLMGMKR
jgi:HAD superfamily hydrolase (TIGR01509 family)